MLQTRRHSPVFTPEISEKCADFSEETSTLVAEPGLAEPVDEGVGHAVEVVGAEEDVSQVAVEAADVQPGRVVPEEVDDEVRKVVGDEDCRQDEQHEGGAGRDLLGPAARPPPRVLRVDGLHGA